jgi:acyl-CoA synthetase (AMP-forming)/AMP-acid ligase II
MPDESSASVPPTELVEWCSDRLAQFKIPRYVVYRTGDFPRTPSLRVRKDELRQEEVAVWDRYAE